MAVSSLVFPSFLSNPEYENKKVTFKTLKPKNIQISDSKSGSHLLKSAVDYVSDLGDKAVAGTDSYIRNLTGIPDGFDLDSCVTLPYPISLSDNQNHNWENTEGLLAQGARGVMSVVKSGISGMSGAKDLLSKVVGKAGDNVDPEKFYAATLDHLGVRKAVIDPGYFQNYNGSAPRSFTMAYTLVPQSQKEAQTIKDIILWFKQYSSPTRISGSPLMGAPFIFNISFAGNQYISDMFKMDKCVLTGISVDYASDGSFMLYKDGFPKQIGLALNFAEVELKYAQDYAGLTKVEVKDERSELGAKRGKNV